MPQRRIPEWVTLVVGTALSVALGIFFYFRTDLKAAFATFAGLLGVTVALLLELLLQSRKATAAQLERDRLSRRIEAVPWLPGVLDDCLTALEGVHITHSGTMAVDMSRLVVEECRERLRDLQRGFLSQSASPEAEIIDLLTQQARGRIIATSPDEDLNWWKTPDGSYYLQRQKEAVARGVTVERIFIHRGWTTAHEETAAGQAALGFTVLRVSSDRVSGIRNSALIIWDRACGFIGEYNSSGSFISSRFTFSGSDIRQLETNFKLIRAAAEPWSPGTSVPVSKRQS